MLTTPMTAIQAHTVYDVLTRYAGADHDGRENFVTTQLAAHPMDYRFRGALGAGGKFWNYGDRWYVTAYPEDTDRDPDLETAIAATNAVLKVIHDHPDIADIDHTIATTNRLWDLVRPRWAVQGEQGHHGHNPRSEGAIKPQTRTVAETTGTQEDTGC